MSAEMSFDHYSKTDIPHAVSQAISSWRRTMSNARPAAASTIYREATRELRSLAKTDPTVHSVVEQSLFDMAASAGIDVNAEIGFVTEQPTAPLLGVDGWPAPQPITSTLPPVEPFIPELLPDGIREYVMDVADRQQAPPDFAAVTALCGIAAVIGNRVRIRPKQNDDWEVVPNLWGAIVGRPSAMKSPAMQAALAPIYAIQDDLHDKWEDEIKSVEIDDALSGLDAKDAKKKAEKALKGGDRDAARALRRYSAARRRSSDRHAHCLVLASWRLVSWTIRV